jgi:hypothetical protein
MKLKALMTVLLAAVFLMPGAEPAAAAAEARIQFPQTDQMNADKKTLNEFTTFYEKIEQALAEEDVDKMMAFYAEDYLHHGITKKQLKFMWLEVFSNFADLYSVHVFTKITVHGDDAILVCTGGLFGIAKAGEDYTTVDQWVTQPHWLTKANGEWKMIGGATHQSPRKRGQKLELHPFF